MSRKMPHNNRVSGSQALRTNDMWANVIGHNPYAAEGESNAASIASTEQAASIMLLAKMSNLSGDDNRGACKRCGMVGHLTFQCRNEVQPVKAIDSDSSDLSSSDDSSASERPSETAVTHMKRRRGSDTDSIDSRRDRKREKNDRDAEKSKKKSSKKHKSSSSEKKSSKKKSKSSKKHSKKNHRSDR